MLLPSNVTPTLQKQTGSKSLIVLFSIMLQYFGITCLKIYVVILQIFLPTPIRLYSYYHLYSSINASKLICFQIPIHLNSLYLPFWTDLTDNRTWPDVIPPVIPFFVHFSHSFMIIH